jgi:hypothetical protein
MPYSQVERDAFRPRDKDGDCPRLTNGLHAIESHCQRCANLIRACRPRAYQVYDYLGRVFTSDYVEVA